ncbi:extracellular solute-binding protein [candidate division WWE3 bacterium]|uniref:Extracellular solute-binding protein n=1 Tax=candidate division WWE3 bacterium TaxID=2053526 RepID=A0A7X9E7B7_UNCKA|nr:extracellular solute-binding protein [candidate division WWE3 bacterium]
MKNKKITAILLLVLPFLLTACTLKDLPVIGSLFGGKKVVSKPASITMWGLWESPEVMDTLLKKYKEKSPTTTITYDDRSVVGSSLYKETVLNRIKQAGSPDVVVVHNSWIPEIKDFLSPMPSSLMTVEKYNQTFYPVSSQSAVIDGKILAVPVYYDGIALVYNKQHFDEIDQTTPPTAWEEFRRLALALTVKTENGEFVRAGAAIGTADNIDFFADILGLMFSQAGINIPSDLDTKAAQDALSFYTMFVTEDKVWDKNFPEATKAFSQGKVSMIFVPTWNLLDIIRANPTMDIGVAQVPQAVADSPTSWANFWMYAVPKSSENQEAAWDLINFLTQDEQQLAIFNEASKYRAYGAPFSSVALSSQAASGSASKYIKPVLDTAPFAKSGYFTGRVGNTLQVEALKTAVNAVLGEGGIEKKLTSEEALKACKETLIGAKKASSTN